MLKYTRALDFKIKSETLREAVDVVRRQLSKLTLDRRQGLVVCLPAVAKRMLNFGNLSSNLSGDNSPSLFTTSVIQVTT